MMLLRTSEAIYLSSVSLLLGYNGPFPLNLNSAKHLLNYIRPFLAKADFK